MVQFDSDRQPAQTGINNWLTERHDVIAANLERLGAGDLVEMVTVVAG